MSTMIKYVHGSNFRELDAADLKKAGVDGFKKTTFAKDEPVEVEDNVAAALVDNESGLFDDEFEYVEDDEALDEPDQGEQLTAAQKKAKAKADADAAKSQTATGSTAQSGAAGGTAATGTNTGNGSSTASS